MVRNGLAYLATPLGRVESTQAPSADLITDLDQGRFLESLRREARGKDASASLKRANAQLENALFALTRPGGGRQAIQRVLILLGEVMQTLAVSRKGQEAVPVLPSLSESWVLQADDGSAEFRLAVALASLVDVRAYLVPVDRDKGRWQWAPESRLHVWGKGDFTRNLVRIVERRVIETQRQETARDPFAGRTRLGARLADIEALLSGQTDDARIAALLQGLVWAKLPETLAPATKVRAGGASVPTAYAVLKPFFTPPALLKHLGRLPEDSHLTLPGELPRLLAGGQVQKAQDVAWRRARIAGLGWPSGDAPQSPALNGPRLLAALAIPLEPAALAQILPRVEDPQPEPV
jgi:CRISPR-associated protein Csx17